MKVIVLLLLIISTSCSSKVPPESHITDEDLNKALRFIPLISSLTDEVDEDPNFEGGENSDFAPTEDATTCTRDFDPCDNGDRNLAQTCSFVLGSLERNISHGYHLNSGVKKNDCSLNSGDFIVRNFNIIDQRGLEQTVYRSQDHWDYKGAMHGGGVRLLDNNGNFFVEITGAYASKMKEELVLEDVTFFTSQSFRLNKINRNNRIFNAGLVVYRDNLKKWEGTVRVDSLVYGINCCHPYQGFMNLILEGESVDLTFQGCGVVKASGLFGHKTLKLDLCQ